MENIQEIKISKLEVNKGQIEGLPANPRAWDNEDVERLANSLEETPELLECRPLLVTPNGNKFVVLGGNMRLAALKKLKRQLCPCIVLDNITVLKMKEIVLKDNSSFGEWDTDELANAWDDLPLADYGISLGGIEAAGMEFDNQELDVEEFDEDMTMNFRFDAEDMAKVRGYFADKDPKQEILRLTGYEQD